MENYPRGRRGRFAKALGCYSREGSNPSFSLVLPLMHEGVEHEQRVRRSISFVRVRFAVSERSEEYPEFSNVFTCFAFDPLRVILLFSRFYNYFPH
jgi:hypothetical protein